jgi:hypothetical protein
MREAARPQPWNQEIDDGDRTMRCHRIGHAGCWINLDGISRKRGAGQGRDRADMLAAISFPRVAPVGHRQQRTADIPDTQQTSPIELQLKREDEEIDKKLSICRGC